jgi:hypothetical protein
MNRNFNQLQKTLTIRKDFNLKKIEIKIGGKNQGILFTPNYQIVFHERYLGKQTICHCDLIFIKHFWIVIDHGVWFCVILQILLFAQYVSQNLFEWWIDSHLNVSVSFFP